MDSKVDDGDGLIFSSFTDEKKLQPVTIDHIQSADDEKATHLRIETAEKQNFGIRGNKEEGTTPAQSGRRSKPVKWAPLRFHVFPKLAFEVWATMKKNMERPDE